MSEHIERLVGSSLRIGDKDAVFYLKELSNQRIELAFLMKEVVDSYKSTLDKRYLDVIKKIESTNDILNASIKRHLNLYYIVNEGYGLN